MSNPSRSSPRASFSWKSSATDRASRSASEELPATPPLRLPPRYIAAHQRRPDLASQINLTATKPTRGSGGKNEHQNEHRLGLDEKIGSSLLSFTRTEKRDAWGIADEDDWWYGSRDGCSTNHEGTKLGWFHISIEVAHKQWQTLFFIDFMMIRTSVFQIFLNGKTKLWQMILLNEKNAVSFIEEEKTDCKSVLLF